LQPIASAAYLQCPLNSALLFDQNLSFKLCSKLAEEFPGCKHVRDAGLSSADDADVWKHAAAKGLIIVSKDQDFRQRAMLFGPPPKCLWIRLGNCSTADIASLLKRRAGIILAFQNGEERLLILDERMATSA
jgi:predicted nuclease of predicted toxin-antitoxin system